MIYEPQPFFNVQASLISAFINALARLAADYIRGQGQPWAYYLGYGFGGAALATGIPGAQAILYAIGAGTVRVFFEKSPGAAEAQIFLDGVSQGNLNLNDEIISVVDYIINIPNDGQYHSLSILNLGSLIPTDATDWLSILAVETSGSTLSEREQIVAAVAIISLTIQDAKTIGTARVKNKQSVAGYVPLGANTLADLTAWHDAFADAVDAITEGKIVGSSITIKPDLPAGLKATAVAGSDVQEGGNFAYSKVGSAYAEAIRVPAILQSLIGADGQNIANAGNVALFSGLLLGTAPAPADFAASDENGINLEAFLAGKKSFRK